MSTSRNNRRKRERRSSTLYLRFVNHRTGEAVGDLADISHDGFKLESTKPIRLHVEFSFRIDVPPEISEQPFIKLTARSLWSVPDPLDSRLYDTGFEIISIDPGDRRAFEVIIERYSSSRTSRDISMGSSSGN
jgi:hypothetical protein